MKQAMVFDWDGSIVTENKRVNTVASLICQTHGVEQLYQTALQTNVSSGWERKGITISLAEDVFTHNFGILAHVLLQAGISKTVDDAWSIILQTYRENYRLVTESLNLEIAQLVELSQFADLYVFSNSDPDNIQWNMDILGIPPGIISVKGDAKKYKAEGLRFLGIPVQRPVYQEALVQALHSYNRVVVIGNNFGMDLLCPYNMKYEVAHIPSKYTPQIVLDFVREMQILSTDIRTMVNFLLNKK